MTLLLKKDHPLSLSLLRFILFHLKSGITESEGEALEREKKKEMVCRFTPQMTAAGGWAVPEPGAPCDSHVDAEAQVLGPSSACPGTLVGSWIGSGAAGIGINTPYGMATS